MQIEFFLGVFFEKGVFYVYKSKYAGFAKNQNLEICPRIVNNPSFDSRGERGPGT